MIHATCIHVSTCTYNYKYMCVLQCKIVFVVCTLWLRKFELTCITLLILWHRKMVCQFCYCFYIGKWLSIYCIGGCPFLLLSTMENDCPPLLLNYYRGTWVSTCVTVSIGRWLKWIFITSAPAVWTLIVIHNFRILNISSLALGCRWTASYS